MNYQQLPALLLPLIQMIAGSMPPGTPPYVTFGLATAIRILQAFSPKAMAEAQMHGPGHRMAMPAHLPELPAEEQWTPEGMKAWAEQHAA